MTWAGASGQMIRRRSDLLGATECETLKDLGLLCENQLDGDFSIEALPRSAGPGLMLSYSPGWDPRYYCYCMYYPFPLEELWEAVDDLRVQDRFVTGLEWLASEICLVEGFEVVVGIAGEEISHRAARRVGRRTTVLGYPVQDLPDYPYKRKMAGHYTFGEWRARRFSPLYPGCTAEPRDSSDDSEMLFGLRGVDPPAERGPRIAR